MTSLNTPDAVRTRAAELDAVDDEVVVVCAHAEGVGEEEVDVFGGFRGGERVVRGCEARGAALTWLCVVAGREEREVVNPGESEALRGLNVVVSHGGLVQGEAQVADGR